MSEFNNHFIIGIILSGATLKSFATKLHESLHIETSLEDVYFKVLKKSQGVRLLIENIIENDWEKKNCDEFYPTLHQYFESNFNAFSHHFEVSRKGAQSNLLMHLSCFEKMLIVAFILCEFSKKKIIEEIYKNNDQNANYQRKKYNELFGMFRCLQYRFVDFLNENDIDISSFYSNIGRTLLEI